MDFHVSVTSRVLGRVLSMTAENCAQGNISNHGKHATFGREPLAHMGRAKQRERTTFWIRGLAGPGAGMAGKGCG